MRRTLLFAILAFASAMLLPAQERGLDVIAREATGQADIDVGRQYAVIIGIDRYDDWRPLRGAVEEAMRLKSVLERRYWIDEFFELYDRDACAENIRRLFLDTLSTKLDKKDSLLVFYAGHGYLDQTNTGFWIASDGTKNVYDQRGWVPNQQLRNMISGLKAQRILVLADACFAGDFLDTSRGELRSIDSAYYRRALGLTARQVLTSGSSESVPDESEFGRQLVDLLERNDARLIDPDQIYDRIKLGMKKTQPLIGTLPGNEKGASFVLFLREGAGADGSGPGTPVVTVAPPPAAGPKVTVVKSYGSLVVTSASAGTLYLDGERLCELGVEDEARLESVPVGERRLEMRYPGAEPERRSVSIQKGVQASLAFTWRQAPPPRAVPSDLVFVQGGPFSMGSTEGEADEKPVHELRVSDFYLGKYEVTVAEFRLFVEESGYRTTAEREGGGWVFSGGAWKEKSDASWRNPYFLQTDREPVTLVSWHDAVAYCNWRSTKESLRPVYTISGTSVSADWSANGYRLPTEAEWEYAARGGGLGKGQNVKYAGSSSVSEVGWYPGNSGNTTHPVGQKKPNALGLYDMSGNVWEWCWDWYDSSYYGKSAAASGVGRVVRGGSWGDDESHLRVSNRSSVVPSGRGSYLGFRLARR